MQDLKKPRDLPQPRDLPETRDLTKTLDLPKPMKGRLPTFPRAIPAWDLIFRQRLDSRSYRRWKPPVKLETLRASPGLAPKRLRPSLLWLCRRPRRKREPASAGVNTGRERHFALLGYPFARDRRAEVRRDVCVRPFVRFVATAFRADRWRAIAPRFFALERACFDSEECEAAVCPFLFKAAVVALDRVADGLPSEPALPLAESRAACFLVRSETFPSDGGCSSTPARRAFERPMAIACFVELAPCLPSRM